MTISFERIGWALITIAMWEAVCRALRLAPTFTAAGFLLLSGATVIVVSRRLE